MTEYFIAKLTFAPRLLPEVEELRTFVKECNREQAIAPVLSPSAYMAAEGRLAALKELAQAAITLRTRLEELDEVAARESDPDRDSALSAAHRAIMESLES